MRTTVEIDEQLLKGAMRVSGAKTKSEVVRLALELMVRIAQQEKLRSLRGKLHWEGDLAAMCRDRTPPDR